MSFTSISFRDPFLDAKVSVQQYPYGTGSFRSTLDCIQNLSIYLEECLESADEVDRDDHDAQWIFLARERHQKHQFDGDVIGKRMRARKHGGDSEHITATSKKAAYSQQRYSDRLGLL
eukprot:10112511-Karenia_brevis.AAC.1